MKSLHCVPESARGLLPQRLIALSGRLCPRTQSRETQAGFRAGAGWTRALLPFTEHAPCTRHCVRAFQTRTLSFSPHSSFIPEVFNKLPLGIMIPTGDTGIFQMFKTAKFQFLTASALCLGKYTAIIQCINKQTECQ